MIRSLHPIILVVTAVGFAAAVTVVAAAGNGAATSDTTNYLRQAQELAAIAKWANREGLVGLSPASLHPMP
jgi:hypothetical protein